MLSPASSAASATSFPDGAVRAASVQHVRHARLSCKRVPGPPLVSSCQAFLSPAADQGVGDGSNGPAARSFAAPSNSPASLIPATAQSTARTQRSSAEAQPAETSHSQGAKLDTTLQAAQQFLATSGASLLYFTNPSFYMTVRNTLEGGSHSEGKGELEELGDAAQENVMASASAMAALKERFHGASTSVKPSAGGGGSNNPSVSGVEWKRLLYVRQQCRYTGKALVDRPPPLPPGPADALPSSPSAATAAPATSSAGVEAELSVGARFMHSLLHPFVPSTTAPSAAAAANPPEEKTLASRDGESLRTLPHGEGVMTYVLYAMPKPDYNPTLAYAPPTASAKAAGAPLSQPVLFLSPALIPTSVCPALQDLDNDDHHYDYYHPAVSHGAELPSASRLLLLSLVVFEGNFVHGRRHGRGRLTAYGRFVLECTWVDDVPCLVVPRPLSLAAGSSRPDTCPPPPTLRRIHAHVACSPASVRQQTPAEGAGSGPVSWAIRTGQLYMGSLALAAPATKRLLTKLDHMAAAPTASTLAVVVEAHGGRYVHLALPQPSAAPSSFSPEWSSAAAANAFSGLAWVDHIVLLPDGLGEAHYTHKEEVAPLTANVPAICYYSSSLFHPQLWVPTHAPLPNTALCTQYCGEWASGLPHGFGVELTRVTDPSAAPLALSSATAGAGPPQYPWRTLFLGQHVRGERCGPGTHHSLQGSEATEVVVCGTWPRTDAAVNVVLLPASASCTGGSGSGSSFFTLQNTKWVEDDRGDGGGGGSGTFPAATLRQSPAALSGMWEPLFRAVDDLISQPNAALSFLPEETQAHVPTSSDTLWQHARCVMDQLSQSAECVAALHTFQACFACIYGCDTAPDAPERPSKSEEDGRCEANLPHITNALLARLHSATAAASPRDDLSLGYPWCPTHSWCGLAHFAASAADGGGPPRTPFSACLHVPLSNSAAHQQQTPRRTQAAISDSAPRRPPLSAVAAALKPHAAAHTFTHAMHAAAAMVSSLRLRLLSCFAAHPDLCEVVMTQTASDDGVLAYCWDLVYRYVGVVLHEKAAAVAVADLRMVWDLLGLDRVRPNGHSNGDSTAINEALPLKEVVARPGWQPEGKETLRDYFTALRRCRALQCTDVVEVSNAESNDVEQHLKALEGCFHSLSLSTTSMIDGRDRTLQGFIGALQQLQILLYGEEEKREVYVDPAAPAKVVHRMHRAHREALLRWLLLAASDPASHSPCAASHPTSCEAARLSHPFALLLIGCYVLSGRVTPRYPTSSHGQPLQERSGATASSLLRVLTDLGCAARQVVHTYPSIRAHTFPRAVVYPVDVLFSRLEYVLSPCAAYHLRTSSSARALASLSVQSLMDIECRVETLESGHPSGSNRALDSPRNSEVWVELDQLPVEVLQLCNEALTDSVTENTLQTRLYRYWSLCSAAEAAGSAANGTPNTIPFQLQARKEVGSRDGDVPPAPSLLVRWVLGCLRSVFSAPLRQPARRGAEATPSPTTSSAAAGDGYTWKRFINAVFFTQEEKSEWAAAAATQRGTMQAVVRPLSMMDYLYVMALAYTLRELSGMALSLTAQFVLQDDDDEDEVDVERNSNEAAGGEAHDDAARCEAGSLQPGAECEHRQDAKPHARSTRRQQGPKKNMFLSSSSSSSSSSESSVTLSTVSSPLAEPLESLASMAADEEEDGSAVEEAHRDGVAGVSPSPERSTPPLSLTPQPQPSVRSSPATTSRRHHQRRGTSTTQADGAVIPLGKEWTLTVCIQPMEECLGKQQTQRRAFASSLLWEVMEQVTALVEHRLQERKHTSGAAEGETHPPHIRPK